LHDQLEDIGADYLATPWDVADDAEAFTGLNLKQARAAECLLALHTALRELPQFGKSKGAAVLHDIAGALRDVVMGGTPRLFMAARPGKRGADGMHRQYLTTFVVWAVRFMVEAHGWTEKQAVRVVAEKFAAAGATGRKGGPLGASTVQDWCNKANAFAENNDHARIHREVEGHMAPMRCDPNWPGEVEESLAWIDRMASDPLLVSKYG
jgi:hypothetical protein